MVDLEVEAIEKQESALFISNHLKICFRLLMKRNCLIEFHVLLQDDVSKFDRDFQIFEGSTSHKNMYKFSFRNSISTNFMCSIQIHRSIDIEFRWN